MKKIEKTKCGKYEVWLYGEIKSTHRTAHKAMESAHKHFGAAYAIIGVKRIELMEHKGALNGLKSVDSDRYLDADGIEHVLCIDGHYEPAETRDSQGRLMSYYEAVVIRR